MTEEELKKIILEALKKTESKMTQDQIRNHVAQICSEVMKEMTKDLTPKQKEFIKNGHITLSAKPTEEERLNRIMNIIALTRELDGTIMLNAKSILTLTEAMELIETYEN